MLIAFRVSNHRSLRDEQVITLRRSARLQPLRSESAGDDWGKSLTTVAAFYGGNASGKSNILSALAFMRRAVIESHATWRPEQDIPHQPFLLGHDAPTRPSMFEVEIVVEGTRMQYGFEHDQRRFVREWLYAYPHGRHRQTWFERNEEDETEPWYFGKNLTGQNRLVAETTRPNSLFLAAAATSQHKRLISVYRWFARNLHIADAENFDARMSFTMNRLDGDPTSTRLATNLLRHADLGIVELKVRRRKHSPEDRDDFLRIARTIGLDDSEVNSDDELLNRVLHRAGTFLELQHKSAHGTPVSLPFEAESLGTRSLVALIGPILSALNNGSVLLVDEVDTSLHPRLLAEIIRLFSSSKSNPRHAQLIFSTHDTSLLGGLLDGPVVLERDQIWFVRKDAHGSTQVYPLSDFSPRKAENLERGYLQGRYGAIPFLDGLSDSLSSDFTLASG